VSFLARQDLFLTRAERRRRLRNRASDRLANKAHEADFQPSGKARNLSQLLMATALGAAPGLGAAQDVSLDGRSNSTIRINGVVTDVRTSTIRNGSGVNSFNKLNVSQGRTVNLHVPAGADRTINLVRDRRSDIAGTLNSMQGGQIGGGIIIANPNGLIVTSSGRVNAGSFSVSTPTTDFIDTFFDSAGRPRDAAMQALIDGTAPQQSGAGIVINGQVRAGSHVRLRAGGDIDVGGREAFVSQFANTGSVRLQAGGNVTVSGTIRAQRAGSRDGGSIDVRGAGDAVISGTLDASGVGDGHGGRVVVLVDRDAVLEQSGTMLAEAPGAGDGGFIELSGKKTVTMIGDISARSVSGQKGSVLIDPETFEIVSENMFTDGQDFTVIATQRIFVGDGVIISTKDPDPLGNAFFAGGPAGDLTLRAPEIEIGAGAQLLAPGGANRIPGGSFWKGGVITLEAIADDTLTSAGIAASEARIIIGNEAVIQGRDVNIRAQATSTLDVASITDAPSFTSGGVPGSLSEAVNRAAAIAVDELADAFDVTLVPARLTARANITSEAQRITASGGDVNIEAVAETRVNMAPEADAFALLGVSTATEANVVLKAPTRESFGTQFGLSQQFQASAAFEEVDGVGVSTGGTVNITARTVEDHAIKADAREGGALAGVALGVLHRTQRATVGLDRGNVNNQTQPPVTFNGRTNIRALSEQSIDIEADATTQAGIGIAAIADIARGQTVVAGGADYLAGDSQIDVEARTTVSKYRTIATASNGERAGLSDADVRSNLDSAAGNFSDEVAPGSTAASGGVANLTSPTEGAPRLAAALVFSNVDLDTRATTGSVADVGTAVAGGNGEIRLTNGFEGDPDGRFDIRATTDVQHLDIGAHAVNDTAGVVVAGSYADWDIGTQADLADIQVSSEDANAVAFSMALIRGLVRGLIRGLIRGRIRRAGSTHSAGLIRSAASTRCMDPGPTRSAGLTQWAGPIRPMRRGRACMRRPATIRAARPISQQAFWTSRHKRLAGSRLKPMIPPSPRKRAKAA